VKLLLILCGRDTKAFLKDRKSHLVSLLAPFFFLYLFSEWFRSEHIDDPVPFMLVGLVVIEIFQFALRASASTIENMGSTCAVEAPRLHIAAGQLLAVTGIATVMGFIIFLVGFFIGIGAPSVWALLSGVGMIVFLGLVFSSFGLFLAVVIRNPETLGALITALTLTLPFFSGAYVFISLLPELFHVISYYNPLTYAVAFFRVISLGFQSTPVESLLDMELAFEVSGVLITPLRAFSVLAIFGLVFLTLFVICFKKPRP